MAPKFEYKNIAVTDLLVNPTNPRFRPVVNQVEAIERMLETQKGKLVRLAGDIMKHGVNPADITIVTPDTKNPLKYLVQEGNRRTTILKLLNNPDLADKQFKFIHSSRFKELADEFASNPITELHCVVYPAKEDTDHWVQLKHTGNNEGIGTESWDAQQAARFAGEQSGRPSEALQVIDYLSTSPTFDAVIKAKLDDVNSSTLQRLLGTKAVKEFLGIKLSKGVLYASLIPTEFERGVGKIVSDILTGMSARDMDKKSHREEYIWSFDEEYTPDTSKVTEKDWALNTPQDAVPAAETGPNTGTGSLGNGPDGVTTSKTKDAPNNGSGKEAGGSPSNQPVAGSGSDSNTSTRSNRLSTDRETLLPRKFVANIQNNRANKIYRELKKLNVNDFENASGVLFRVFVEVSTDIYIDKQALSTVNKNSKLRHKVEAVAKHMETSGFSDQYKLKGVRNAVSNDHIILSIHTFNAIVHNPDYSPDALSLKKAWDNIEPYMEALWQHA